MFHVPCFMPIIGHKKILDLLNKGIVRGTIAQTYLFSGPEHSGKFTVALDFAERLSGGNADMNPDLIIIQPEISEKKGLVKKADIKIEQIRDLSHKLSLMPAGGKYKVAIIDDADRLNKAAQNALLKTLEEPNDKIVLILISQNNKKLLATLKSRCQRVKFGPVSREELEENIPAWEKNREAIIFWSLGRPGLMLELVKNKNEIDFREEAAAELKMLMRNNLAEKFALAETLGKDTRKAARKLNLWTIILRENLLGKSNVGQNQQKCFSIIENIEKSLARIKETNANTRLILENLFLHF
jgi:DNA polymerase III subunit delta'